VLDFVKTKQCTLVKRKRYRRPTDIVSIFWDVWVNISRLGKKPMSLANDHGWSEAMQNEQKGTDTWPDWERLPAAA